MQKELYMNYIDQLMKLELLFGWASHKIIAANFGFELLIIMRYLKVYQ